MKILVMCPGNFTHGLDSPERGEGRWSQNYALMLAQAGHDIYAASMGNAGWTDRGVKLVHETRVAEYGPYDLFIDSAWWREKRPPPGVARKYVILKWALETYLMEDPLPENHYIGFPYPSHKHYFDREANPHRDRCFALPTTFGDFRRPNVDSKRIFLPGKLPDNRPHQKFMPAIIDSLSKHPLEGVCSEDMKAQYSAQLDKAGNNFFEKLPYSHVMHHMGQCRVNVPIMSPACLIEATANGLASIFWQEGQFFPALAENLGVTIRNEDPPEKFSFILERMMRNDKFFQEIVFASQDYFVCHRHREALRYFDLFVQTVF